VRIVLIAESAFENSGAPHTEGQAQYKPSWGTSRFVRRGGRSSLRLGGLLALDQVASRRRDSRGERLPPDNRTGRREGQASPVNGSRKMTEQRRPPVGAAYRLLYYRCLAAIWCWVESAARLRLPIQPRAEHGAQMSQAQS
jgi:hypothetical protein